MQAGKLRHRVELQEDVGTTEGPLGTVPDWVTRARPWAEIEPTSGREFFASKQVQAEMTHQVRIRGIRRFTPSPKWRFLWGTRKFGIVHIQDVSERGIELVFVCRELV